MAEARFKSVLSTLRRLAGGGPADAEADAALLARFLSGDQSAFAALVHRHGSLVWNVCRRVLGDDHAADDAFQATFLVLLRRAPSLQGGSSLAGWLHAVALRTALKARAEAARRKQREASVPEPDMTHRRDADWQLLRPVLDEELARLSDKYRQPIVLCYLEGKTNDEAAAILGWTRGTVAGRLSRARDLLRERLSRRGITLAPALLWTLIAEQARAASVPAAALDAAARLPVHVPDPINQLAQGVLANMYQQKLRNVLLYAAASVVAVVLAGVVYTAVVPDQPARPKVVEGGKPVNGFQLKLTAVKDTTTTLNADGRNAAPVEFMLTLTNVSDKPLKLDTYDMRWELEVTGPTPNSVTTAKALADVQRTPPTAEHYPLIQPGKSWQQTFTFPGSFANAVDERTLFGLTKRGDYRLKATYTHPRVMPYPPAAGSWIGDVVSNELFLTVK